MWNVDSHIKIMSVIKQYVPDKYIPSHLMFSLNSYIEHYYVNLIS